MEFWFFTARETRCKWKSDWARCEVEYVLDLVAGKYFLLLKEYEYMRAMHRTILGLAWINVTSYVIRPMRDREFYLHIRFVKWAAADCVVYTTREQRSRRFLRLVYFGVFKCAQYLQQNTLTVISLPVRYI